MLYVARRALAQAVKPPIYGPSQGLPPHLSRSDDARATGIWCDAHTKEEHAWEQASDASRSAKYEEEAAGNKPFFFFFCECVNPKLWIMFPDKLNSSSRLYRIKKLYLLVPRAREKI